MFHIVARESGDHVFIEADPRKDGFNGAVDADVTRDRNLIAIPRQVLSSHRICKNQELFASIEGLRKGYCHASGNESSATLAGTAQSTRSVDTGECAPTPSHVHEINRKSQPRRVRKFLGCGEELEIWELPNKSMLLVYDPHAQLGVAPGKSRFWVWGENRWGLFDNQTIKGLAVVPDRRVATEVITRYSVARPTVPAPTSALDGAAEALRVSRALRATRRLEEFLAQRGRRPPSKPRDP